MLWLAGDSPEARERCAPRCRKPAVPAAVLVPLVERDAGLTVLLTQRAATLKDHAGQISFPGGRIEPEDADRLAARRCARRTRRSACPDGSWNSPATCPITGWEPASRVTPAVGFVEPAVRAAHRDRRGARRVRGAARLHPGRGQPPARGMRRIGEVTLEVYDIPYGERMIWGATAGMLLTFTAHAARRAQRRA